jgi:formylglycine-generating enzyme required for sulfatase activity
LKAACEFFGGRLRTEAEREYAARAGRQTAWSFGNDEERLGEYAWYGANSGNTPHTVGAKKANAWGLHDMHGNVWEWVADWYGPYTSGAQTDPSGPAAGGSRVLRGGSFYSSARVLRSASRGRGEPKARNRGFGFRCARGPRRQP